MIGKRIQYYRQLKRMSLTELANRAGVAKSYLSSIERNIQHNPSIEFLNKITVVLGVDIHTLLREQQELEALVFEKEWLQLAHEVRASGMSIDEVKYYITNRNQ